MITLVNLLQTTTKASVPVQGDMDLVSYNPSLQMTFDWPSIKSLGGGHTMTESTGGNRRAYDDDADDDE